MILEMAVLKVKAGQTQAFENAFAEAQAIISSMPGYHWHQLQKCLENSHQYLLLVQWETLAAHTEGFRQSPEYQRWRELLHHFYSPMPTVEHYQLCNLQNS